MFPHTRVRTILCCPDLTGSGWIWLDLAEYMIFMVWFSRRVRNTAVERMKYDGETTSIGYLHTQ